MSPASKKSKDKKASKEPQKASSKLPGPTSAVAGVPTSAYNPASGTFHALIDEADEHHGGALGSGIEYDSASNNGSWSGESEDLKEKLSNPPARQETINGAPDNDKREKIRQKNEKKHQRQKERRAQELHDRFSSFLMSRKLETLAEKLVAMGFSHERATMALMLNEGKVEESVSWLFEGGENSDQNIGECNLKVDISEELAQISEMEKKYKCSKQEVERAVVASEGDLEKAAEHLKAQKPDSSSVILKPDEKGDPPISNKLSAAPSQNSIVKPQPKPYPAPVMIQQGRDERDFNYTKATVPIGIATESINRNVQPLKKIQPKMDWAKPQQTSLPAEKRFNLPVSYSLASPLQAPPPARTENRYVAVGTEYTRNLQPGSVREPVIVMQRPQYLNVKQIPVTNSISSSPPASWHPSNGMETLKSSFMPHIPTTTISPRPDNFMHHIPTTTISSKPDNFVPHYHQQHFAPSSSSPDDYLARGNGLWSRVGPSSTISAASSLGLYCGLGSAVSTGPFSRVDWSTDGSMARSDYTSVDWSLDPDLSSVRNNGLWQGGPSSSINHARQIYDSNINGVGPRAYVRNGNVAGFHGGVGVSAIESSTQEWTSPFEGKDLFSLPRRFVSSPSL
ncbi:hypothetical protein ACFE04_017067 [Oxalis oulophora]